MEGDLGESNFNDAEADGSFGGGIGIGSASAVVGGC